MPFDTMTAAAVTDELRQTVVGGRIQKILQPAPIAVGLNLYAGGQAHWLLLSAEAQTARVQLASERLAKAYDRPSAFIMLLRKYLEGGRLLDVEQLPGERVLILRVESGAGASSLVAEVMGKHSNVVLVGVEERVLGALKVVPRSQSRVRPVVPGGPWVPPPPQPRDTALYPPGSRLWPGRDDGAIGALLTSLPGDTLLQPALLGILGGASPFLASQIAQRAGVEPQTPLASVDVAAIISRARDLYRLYESHHWSPSVFRNQRGREDFAAFEPVQVGEVQRVLSISEAMGRVLGGREERDSLATVRRRVLDQAEAQLASAARRGASLQRGLEASAEAQTVMEQGQMILAYQHRIAPRAVVLEIPEVGMRVPLDPTLTAVENAERFFRRYHKLRDATSRIPPLLTEVERERERLEDIVSFARLAANEGDLRDLEREISRQPDGVRKRPAKRGPMRYRIGEYTVLAGRNARENEEVTFDLAHRQDLWLHAHERTGAHVIIREGQTAPEEVILQAASLAAYLSAGRHDTAVEVDCAAVRQVRKIPGAAPGRVTYRALRTVRVVPALPTGSL